jgi:hypothetical protein
VMAKRNCFPIAAAYGPRRSFHPTTRKILVVGLSG